MAVGLPISHFAVWICWLLGSLNADFNSDRLNEHKDSQAGLGNVLLSSVFAIQMCEEHQQSMIEISSPRHLLEHGEIAASYPGLPHATEIPDSRQTDNWELQK